MSAFKYTALMIFSFLVLHVAPGPLWADEGVAAITKPSADIDLSFVQPGRISKLLASEGQTVKKGTILATLEDEVEMVQYSLLTQKAEDTTRIEIARAEVAQKEKDLHKMVAAHKKGAVTEWETAHARLDLETTLLNLKYVQFEQGLNQLKKRELKAVLDQFTLASPINGVIEEMKIEVGESVQAFSSIIRVININPLRVDVAVPTSQANSLKNAQKVKVQFSDGSALEGSVENIFTVIDAGANTRRVHVKLPNPNNRPAGERVSVSF